MASRPSYCEVHEGFRTESGVCNGTKNQMMRGCLYFWEVKKNASNQSGGWWIRKPIASLQLLAFRLFSGFGFDDLLAGLVDKMRAGRP